MLSKRARGAAVGAEINVGEIVITPGGELGLGPTVCDPSEYEVAAPTATSDRRCGESVVCHAKQYEAAPHTATSSRVCIDHTECTAHEFITKEAGTHHNRE